MVGRVFAGVLISLHLFVQAQPENCKKTIDLFTFIQNHHIHGVPVDRDFSRLLFIEFFHTLDPQKKILSDEDLATLRHHETRLMDDLRRNNCIFLQESIELYRNRLVAYEKWVIDFLSQPVDLEQPDVYPVFQHLKQRPHTQRQLNEERIRNLKHEILEFMYRKAAASSQKENVLRYEADARSLVRKNELYSIQKSLNPKTGFEQQVLTALLKAIAKVFDPHTEYFSFLEATAFVVSLSDRAPGFGFTFEENESAEIVIDRIIPGGPAWNSNEIHKGDLLLGLTDQQGTYIDLSALDIDRVAEVLQNPELPSCEIHFRKADGQVKRVVLTKKEIEQDENTVKSFVLEGKHKVGYIALPGFYTQWENDKAQGCAADMAKEILKLKKEKIEGLILDLRFNGGGALHEALNLAGIFIDTGPLILYQQRGQPIAILKDMNRGTIYDGPLIVMVNGFSASASELITATLQDYNRALVVGTRTFGKGTGQEVLSLPASIQEKGNRPAMVKITTDRVYRITGKSYQHRGVLPDIELADITMSIPERESLYRNTLPPDSVNKKVYYTALTPLPVQQLKSLSMKRREVGVPFQQAEKLFQHLVLPVPLKLNDYFTHKEKITMLYKEFESSDYDFGLFKASGTLFDSTLMKIDPDRNRQQQKFAGRLEKNIYINETFQIMSDLISLTHN
jgi:carboxyl-terminal processing protease